MSGAANLRFGVQANDFQNKTNINDLFKCHPSGKMEATIILCLGGLGMSANVVLMILLLAKKHLRR